MYDSRTGRGGTFAWVNKFVKVFPSCAEIEGHCASDFVQISLDGVSVAFVLLCT
jgi:hypothetical protein